MIERRKHKRYVMPHGTLAILRSDIRGRLLNHEKMSIGEIAMVLYKSESDMIGEVADLSLGGLSFNGTFNWHDDMERVQLDLLMTEQGIYLHNIPYAAVPVCRFPEGSQKKSAMRTNALRFKGLNTKQKDQLQALMAFHVG
ncbi:hypothetical protein DSCO28_02430 [Desulfosarcina ovata subsp. sediminis]|uniref:PilZ domain-containing protein n=1 Tax=Desulfosarcina ovata subsp. sediminis TaxID=885957 RepID=A0A5K7ZI94_9BACT|nr:hypothetical protein [Desulfosarcina ovata]BBO79677.1 hypothetical protein DSCO28_02430 [Desulfosarcina ovata subsp. sediminis]